MIATGKPITIKPELDVVKIFEGYAYYTNTFVMFKKGIADMSQIDEPIYISLEEWKKVQKQKSLTLVRVEQNVATFRGDKSVLIDCIAKKDVAFPDISQLKIGDITHKIKISVDTLELLIKQAKIDKKYSLEMEFTDKPLSRIAGTEYLFTRNIE